ncbi:MAG: lipopolysaccharide biosynthesis protein [bacterium]|nr:MAG: lipopolysaccharide biosynthesis protein [bacterium]
MERRSKIAENTLSLTASGAGSAVLAIIQLSILSRSLEGDLFGLFVALRGFSLLLGTVVLIGLPQVLVRFLPSYQSRGMRDRALILFTVSTGLVLLLGYLIHIGSPVWAEWMPEDVGGLVAFPRVTLWVTLASVMLAMKMLLYGGFNGLREMRMQMVLELLYHVLLTVFIFAARHRLGVTLLFQIICVLNTFVFLMGLPVFVRLARRLIPAGGAGGDSGLILPPLVPYWLGSILLSFVSLAFTDVDRYVMSAVLPLSAISIFHVASRINNLLRRFLGIPVIAAQPEITRIYEEGRWEELAGKIGLFTKGTIIASLFVSALMTITGRDIITVLSGDRYISGYRVLLVLLVTVPIAAVIAPLLATMRSLHFMKWAVLCDFIWMAVYFGTFFFLVSWWGVIGMAVAQVTASCCQLLAAVLLARREGFFGGVGTNLGRVLLSLVFLVPTGVVLTRQFGLPASAACLLLSPIICKYLLKWLSVFGEEEKERIVELVPVSFGKRTTSWLLSLGA